MGENSTPSYDDRERYLMEYESTWIKDKWGDFMRKVGRRKFSSKSRESSSRITAEEIFSVVRDLFVDNSSCVVDRYKVVALKESVRLPSRIVDYYLNPIVKAVADLKREISSRPDKSKCVKRKDGQFVRFYDMIQGDDSKKVRNDKNKRKSI